MNDKQIYELVAKKPRIRASELATALSVDLAVVSASLRSLVDVGDLVKSKEFDDNGRRSQVYELSDEFRRSREGKALLDGIGLEAAPAPVLVAAPSAAPAEQPAPATAPAVAPPLSKVDRAIACITRLGAATDEQLRTAMDLAPKIYVGAYLASALKAGRVMRDGDRWKLGIGQSPLPALKPDAGPGKTDKPIEVPRFAEQEADKPLQRLKAALQPTRYRCALWSDGVVEIQRDGQALASLPREAADELARFVESLA